MANGHLQPAGLLLHYSVGIISYRKHTLRICAGSFVLFYTFASITITIYIICVCLLSAISYIWLIFPTPAMDTSSFPLLKILRCPSPTLHFKMADFSTLVTFTTPCRTSSIPCKMIIPATVKTNTPVNIPIQPSISDIIDLF